VYFNSKPSLLDRCQPSTGDDHLPALIDCQRGWHRSKFFLNRVPSADSIGEFELQLGHRPTSLFEPGAVIVASRGVRRPVPNDIRIFFSQIRPSLLGGTQLISIRGDLVVQETLCAVHVSSVAAGHLLGEDCQQRLNDILCQDRITVAIGESQQVLGNWSDLEIGAQVFEQRLFFLGGPDPGVEIGEPDQLFQIGPAQQCAQHEVEMTAGVGIRGQPVQERGQERIGIEIDSRH
jgi:hypothetical protein